MENPDGPQVKVLRAELWREPTSEKPPTPAPQVPKRFSVVVVPNRWSPLIHIPRGTMAKATFTIGRIRVEVNGKDEGRVSHPDERDERVDSRKKTTHVERTGVRDRVPHTLFFKSDARMLRFRSGEISPGEVFVEFTDRAVNEK